MAMKAGRDPLARDGKDFHGDSVPWCSSQSQCAGHHAARAWALSRRGHSLASDFTHAGALENKIEQGAPGVGDAANELAVIASVSSQQPAAAFAIAHTSNPCGVNGRKGSRFLVAHHSVSWPVAAKCGEKASAPSARTVRSLIGGGGGKARPALVAQVSASAALRPAGGAGVVASLRDAPRARHADSHPHRVPDKYKGHRLRWPLYLIGGGVAACTKLLQLRHLGAAIAAAEVRQMEAQQGRHRTSVLLHSVVAKGSRSTARSIPENGIEPASVRSLPSTPATGQRSE